MRRYKLNNIIFVTEIAVFTICAIIFAVLGIWGNISNYTANILYIIFIAFSFGYLFALEFLFPKYDNAVHFKAFAKYYVPTGKGRADGYKRTGLASVVLLWIAYLLFVALFKILGVLTWYWFLVGACFMFVLNSNFVRKICLLSVLFLHNKNNCCKNCGINSWDYAIFASALVFAPKLSVVATILNLVIVFVSILMLVVWEINYYKHPYRFYPETNKTLNCKNCLKQCGLNKISNNTEETKR